MKMKILVLFAALMMLQACGTKGSMMHSAASVDNVKVASVDF